MMYNDHSKGGICKNDDLFEKRFAKTGSQDTDIKGERRTAETNDLTCEGIATISSMGFGSWSAM